MRVSKEKVSKYEDECTPWKTMVQAFCSELLDSPSALLLEDFVIKRL